MNPYLIRCLCVLVLLAMSREAAAQQPDKPVAASSHEEVQDCLRKIWKEPALWDYDADAPDQSICRAQPEDIDRVRKSHEEVQDCFREMWGKPIFWDEGVTAPVDPSVCKAPPDKVDEALKHQHLIAFRMPNGVLLTYEGNFDKNYTSFVYKWKTPEINIRLLDRLIPGGRQPTGAELHEVADVVLKRAHLVPVGCPFEASEGQIGRLALNVYVWIHKMHPGSEQESVIVLLADSDADHEMVVGTGRVVYGELQDGHFQYRWESPLVYTSMFEWGFVDLLRNGSLQIILTSPNFGKHHTVFYAFGLDGREISRDPSNCRAFHLLTTHSAVACPIMTDTGIKIEDNESASGPKELVTTAMDDSDRKVRYIFNGEQYEEFPKRKPAKPPSVPRATALNAEGMKLMQESDYQSAIDKFEEAAQLNEMEPLFANNAGFAYYKQGRIQDSLYWFNKAIEIEPKRAVAYLNLGDALVKLNRNAEARHAYQKYLELAPDSKSAPDVKKKLDALPPMPSDPSVIYLNLGDALVRVGRIAEARQAYRKYLELAPDSKAAPEVKKKLEALPPTP